MDKKTLGHISALGTFSLLVLIAVKAEVFSMVLGELFVFLSGGVHEIANSQTTFLMMFPVIFAVIVLAFLSSVIAYVLHAMILGEKRGRHATSDLLEEMEEGNHFFTFFIEVLIEELFARWLFLGLFTMIPFLSGTIAFYVLFLVGNGIWALVHLMNFRREKDRNVLRTLPQFVEGIFFTYVFVKYGLLATILTHFIFNAVLFATHKVQQMSVVNVFIVGYSVLCAAISYMLMTKPVADILPWFEDTPVFRLQGWMFWDYVKISVFLSSCLFVLFGLLLYDRGEVREVKSYKDVVLIVIEMPLLIGFIYGIYALIGLFFASVSYRVLVVAIILTFFQRGSSGSAISRAFWFGLLDVYIAVCILEALGFWLSLCWLAVETLISVPRIILNNFGK